MAVPAFDMEPSSKSAPLEPPASPQPVPAKSASGEAAAGKRPLASLSSIAAKNKPAGPGKAGDLTRFFELARQQTPAEPAPVPISVVPPVPETQPETTPSAIASIETPVAEVLSELKAAPEPARAEAAAEIEPTIVSEAPLEDPGPSFETEVPLLPVPPAVDAESTDAVAPPVPFAGETTPASDASEPLAVMFAPVEETSPRVEIAEPAPEAAEPPAALAPVEPQQARASKFTDLVDYWRSLRVGDDHPAAVSVDHDLVTELWPGSLLISYTPASQDPRGELRPGRVTRLGTCCRETQNAVDAGSHSTEWMLEVARTALINDEPLEEQQRLATLTGDEGFRMVALPLGPPRGLANAVLCTLLPSPGAPRFGKRRTWL